jgi:long-chain acyl-CoA synthetase
MSKTILDFPFQNTKRFPFEIAIKYKKNNIWTSLGWEDHLLICESVAHALVLCGVSKGEKVGILSQTRPEWEFIDIGTMGCGAITIPIYPSFRPEELEYIINDSELKVLFCENIDQYKKWQLIKKNCPSVKKIILIDIPDSVNGFEGWDQFLKSSEKSLEENPKFFLNSCKNIKAGDIATIIYTSGTTGNPKGVVLTHKQIMSEVEDLFSVIEVNQKDTTLTFLPYAHVVGRIEMLGHLYKGYTLAYAESIEKIKKNLTEIKPTLLIAVPRIFEKIYNGILSQIETQSRKEKVFNWALNVGKKISSYKIKNEAPPLSLLLQLQVAKKLVFNKISENLGGQIRFAISGGAPLSKEIAEFFHATGLLILEGYGLTETSAAICVNSPLHYKFGTVGKPLGDVKIKIAEDGEILVSSKKVMKEYFNKVDETQSVFTNGYFHTGDIGEFTDDGFLKITDRKKDLIKTAGGKYVAPQKLESLVKASPFISNVLIHGDQKKYVVALLTLDEINVKEYAISKGISFNDFSTLTKNEKVRELVREIIAEVNSELSSFETIKNFDILEKDFCIEDGELTPSLKVKRKFCDLKYGDLIQKLYGMDRTSM